MKSVDVPSTCRGHLPLEMQSQVVCQEVTGSQSWAAVQSTFTHIQADHEIREAFK